jgi:hypothetical protein
MTRMNLFGLSGRAASRSDCVCSFRDWPSPNITATSALAVTSGFLHLLQRAPFSGVAV